MRALRTCRRPICCLPIVWSILGGLPAMAEDAPSHQPLAVLSWGADSCGRYVQASDNEKKMYVAWTLGFISGANSWDIGKGRMAGQGWDQAGVTVWLTNYCTKDPLTGFLNAAMGLREAFGGNRPIRP